MLVIGQLPTQPKTNQIPMSDDVRLRRCVDVVIIMLVRHCGLVKYPTTACQYSTSGGRWDITLNRRWLLVSYQHNLKPTK